MKFYPGFNQIYLNSLQKKLTKKSRFFKNEVIGSPL